MMLMFGANDVGRAIVAAARETYPADALTVASAVARGDVDPHGSDLNDKPADFKFAISRARQYAAYALRHVFDDAPKRSIALAVGARRATAHSYFSAKDQAGGMRRSWVDTFAFARVIAAVEAGLAQDQTGVTPQLLGVPVREVEDFPALQSGQSPQIVGEAAAAAAKAVIDSHYPASNVDEKRDTSEKSSTPPAAETPVNQVKSNRVEESARPAAKLVHPAPLKMGPLPPARKAAGPKLPSEIGTLEKTGFRPSQGTYAKALADDDDGSVFDHGHIAPVMKGEPTFRGPIKSKREMDADLRAAVERTAAMTPRED